jgi:hypothetical protein
MGPELGTAHIENVFLESDTVSVASGHGKPEEVLSTFYKFSCPWVAVFFSFPDSFKPSPQKKE